MANLFVCVSGSCMRTNIFIWIPVRFHKVLVSLPVKKAELSTLFYFYLLFTFQQTLTQQLFGQLWLQGKLELLNTLVKLVRLVKLVSSVEGHHQTEVWPAVYSAFQNKVVTVVTENTGFWLARGSLFSYLTECLHQHSRTIVQSQLSSVTGCSWSF